MNKSLLTRARANFLAGLAVVLPVVISIAVVVWLFGTIANITDRLLFFLPPHLVHADKGAGPIYWYWSLFAFALTLVIIGVIGRLTRNYLGRQIIEWADVLLLRVPLLNKIYAALKQVNEAFTNDKSSFRQVVLVEFPRDGIYSVGFITGEQNQEVQQKTRQKVVAVFVPTTPNPTSGYLILVPEDKLTKLDMSVADGIKFIISLGAVVPEYTGPAATVPRSAF